MSNNPPTFLNKKETKKSPIPFASDHKGSTAEKRPISDKESSTADPQKKKRLHSSATSESHKLAPLPVPKRSSAFLSKDPTPVTGSVHNGKWSPSTTRKNINIANSSKPIPTSLAKPKLKEPQKRSSSVSTRLDSTTGTIAHPHDQTEIKPTIASSKQHGLFTNINVSRGIFSTSRGQPTIKQENQGYDRFLSAPRTETKVDLISTHEPTRIAPSSSSDMSLMLKLPPTDRPQTANALTSGDQSHQSHYLANPFHHHQQQQKKQQEQQQQQQQQKSSDQSMFSRQMQPQHMEHPKVSLHQQQQKQQQQHQRQQKIGHLEAHYEHQQIQQHQQHQQRQHQTQQKRDLLETLSQYQQIQQPQKQLQLYHRPTDRHEHEEQKDKQDHQVQQEPMALPKAYQQQQQWQQKLGLMEAPSQYQQVQQPQNQLQLYHPPTDQLEQREQKDKQDHYVQQESNAQPKEYQQQQQHNTNDNQDQQEQTEQRDHQERGQNWYEQQYHQHQQHMSATCVQLDKLGTFIHSHADAVDNIKHKVDHLLQFYEKDDQGEKNPDTVALLQTRLKDLDAKQNLADAILKLFTKQNRFHEEVAEVNLQQVEAIRFGMKEMLQTALEDTYHQKEESAESAEPPSIQEVKHDDPLAQDAPLDSSASHPNDLRLLCQGLNNQIASISSSLDELCALGMQLKIEDDTDGDDDEEEEPEPLEESPILQSRLAEALCDLAQVEDCIEENRATIENMKRQKTEQSIIKTTISKFQAIELVNQIKNYQTTSQIIVKELEEGNAKYEVLKNHQEELQETLKNKDGLEIEKSYPTTDDDDDDFGSDQEYEDTKDDSVDPVTPTVVDPIIIDDNKSLQATPVEEKPSTTRKKRKLPGIRNFKKGNATITIESDDEAERLVQIYSQDAADHVYQKLLELKK